MPTVTYTFAGHTSSAGATTTTLPGTEITLLTPNATANIVGDKTDPVDFYGIVLVVVAIAFAIVLTRLVFRRRGVEHEQPR